MFVRIDNTPRDYAWGSTTAIAGLLGRQPSGAPEAELWLGAHPASPSRILDPAQTGGAQDLAQWIARDPEAALGAEADTEAAPRLTFLLKVLAAEGPLSLQAHPSSLQARDGYARENAAGIALDAPERNYKDEFHKPEMIYALSDKFEALCGFREIAESLADVDRLIAAAEQNSTPTNALSDFRSRLAESTDAEQILRGALTWLLASGDATVAELVAEVVTAASRVVETVGEAAGETRAVEGDFRSFETVGTLAKGFPGDPGIVLSLLLHRVTLKRGEALYLPAGNIHAYLNGLGVELMAASDNVLRGGLTPKHVDVPELLHVLHFTPLPVPYLTPVSGRAGTELYRPDVPDFRLVRVSQSVGTPAVNADQPEVAINGAAIALCVEGSVRLRGAISEIALARGEAIYLTPQEASVTVAGDGTVFVATGNAH